MAWSDTPKGADIIRNTQSPMKINFSDLKTAFEINHRALGDALVGVHDKVDFLTIKMANIGTVLDDEILMFNHFSSNEDKLRIKKGSANDYSITRKSGSSTALTSELVMKYGSFVFTGTADDTSIFTVNVKFASSFPTAVYILIINPGFPSTSMTSRVSYTSLTTSGFSAKIGFDNAGRQTNLKYYYMAIGI